MPTYAAPAAKPSRPRRPGAKLTVMTIHSPVPGGTPFNGAAILNDAGFLSIPKAPRRRRYVCGRRGAVHPLRPEREQGRELQRAAGDLLTLDLGGVPVEEWLFTLGSPGSDDLVMMKTDAGQFNSAGGGNEQLSQDSLTLLRHVQEDAVLDFLTTHRDWTASDQ